MGASCINGETIYKQILPYRYLIAWYRVPKGDICATNAATLDELRFQPFGTVAGGSSHCTRHDSRTQTSPQRYFESVVGSEAWKFRNLIQEF